MARANPSRAELWFDAVRREAERRERNAGDWRQWLGPNPDGSSREPHAKQRAFLELDCLEALYGGAAGGGKSDALLMAALQYVHVPGYAALIIRKSYADLAQQGAIMDRARSWFVPRGVEWNEREKRFTFPSGATIAFGYLETDVDKYRYQGTEIQYLGLDEATQHPESRYTFLLSRLRRPTGSNVPLRARLASNPGGIGHDWVKRRFVDDATREGRAFVPATLDENPHIDREAYDRALAQLDPTTRKQLREGVWIRDTSGLVYAHFDEMRNVVDAPPVEGLWHFLCGIDFGIVDQNAISVIAYRDHDPCVYVVRAYRVSAIPSEMAAEVRALSEQYRFEKIVGDVGGLGKAFAEEMRRRWQIPVHPAEKHDKAGHLSLFNGSLAEGRIKVVRDACADLLEEWHALAWNEARTKEAEGMDNHASDATLYAWRACHAFMARPAEPKPAEEDRMLKTILARSGQRYWQRKRFNVG